MFNNESPRRGETFVTRKITRAATRIKLGLQKKLVLGNLDAKRDWNHSKDTVRGMYMVATSDVPDDYTIASGEMHSVQEFVEMVFEKLDLDWKKYVEIDERYFRPSEVDALCGDSTKIREKLGWEPHYSFKDLVEEMVQHDLALAGREKVLKDIL
jgi:GDPmannose 4,6-dehydratase